MKRPPFAPTPSPQPPANQWPEIDRTTDRRLEMAMENLGHFDLDIIAQLHKETTLTPDKLKERASGLSVPLQNALTPTLDRLVLMGHVELSAGSYQLTGQGKDMWKRFLGGE